MAYVVKHLIRVGRSKIPQKHLTSYVNAPQHYCWRSDNFKMSFWRFEFFQITNENNLTWGIIVVKSNFFVRFLEEFKTQIRHFEINWPLILQRTNLLTSFFKPPRSLSVWLLNLFNLRIHFLYSCPSFVCPTSFLARNQIA